MIIKLENVNKVFISKTKERTDALQDINLSLAGNKLIGIIGKSGSGKTTLLNIIYGLEKPTSGNVYIENININKISNNKLSKIRKNYFSYINQNTILFENLTVDDNLKIVCNLMNIVETQDEIINNYLNKYDIINLKTHKINELSGGQKQLIQIITSLIKDSKIILCDEPTANLDAENTRKIIKILKELSKEKLVLLVSHDIDLINKYSDTIIEIKDGCIKTIDDKEEVQNIILDDNNNKDNKNKINFLFKLNFKLNKILTFSNILFTLLFIFLLAIILSISEFKYYNFDNYLKTSYENSNVVEIGKYDKESNYHTKYPFNYQEKNQIISKLGNQYYNYIYNFESRLNDEFSFMGMVELDDEIMEKFNYKIVEGKMPETYNQIVISKYYYEYIKSENKDYNNIINKLVALTIGDSYYIYEVSGIIDDGYKCISEFVNDSSTNLALFVKKGFYYGEYQFKWSKEIANDYYLNLPTYVNYLGKEIYLGLNADNINNAKSKDIIFFDENNTFEKLEDNEVIIELNYYNKLKKFNVANELSEKNISMESFADYLKTYPLKFQKADILYSESIALDLKAVGLIINKTDMSFDDTIYFSSNNMKYIVSELEKNEEEYDIYDRILTLPSNSVKANFSDLSKDINTIYLFNGKFIEIMFSFFMNKYNAIINIIYYFFSIGLILFLCNTIFKYIKNKRKERKKLLLLGFSDNEIIKINIINIMIINFIVIIFSLLLKYITTIGLDLAYRQHDKIESKVITNTFTPIIILFIFIVFYFLFYIIIYNLDKRKINEV